MKILQKKINPGRPGNLSKPSEHSGKSSFIPTALGINFIPGGIYITESPGGPIVEVNNAFISLFGHARHEAIGSTFFDLGIIEAAELLRIRNIVQMKGKLLNEEVRCRHKNGQAVFCLVTTSAIDLNGSHLIMSLFTDITPIKEQNHIASHTDTFDSLNYARRIQEAVFPSETFIKRILPKCFVLFKPKTLVSGDFYWIETFGSKTYVAVGDCTGRGISGAMAGILVCRLLSKSINQHAITRPGDILNDLSMGICRALHRNSTGTGVSDGIDMAVICIDHKNGILEYAGAYNPIYLVRKSALTRLSTDRFSVGVQHGAALKEFTHHQILVFPDDSIYLFSNGYADQFGGPSGKKFKNAQFQQLLLSLQDLSMPQQKEALEETMESWKGNEEQMDDILVMGIKI